MIIAQCCIIKPAVSVWRGERGEGEGTHHADLRPLKGRTGLFMRIMSPSSHPIQRTMGSLQLKWLKSRPSGSREWAWWEFSGNVWRNGVLTGQEVILNPSGSWIMFHYWIGPNAFSAKHIALDAHFRQSTGNVHTIAKYLLKQLVFLLPVEISNVFFGPINTIFQHLYIRKVKCVL